MIVKKKTFKLTGIQKINRTWIIEGELEDGGGIKMDVGEDRQMVEVNFDSIKLTDDKTPELVKEKGYKIIGRG